MRPENAYRCRFSRPGDWSASAAAQLRQSVTRGRIGGRYIRSSGNVSGRSGTVHASFVGAAVWRPVAVVGGENLGACASYRVGGCLVGDGGCDLQRQQKAQSERIDKPVCLEKKKKASAPGATQGSWTRRGASTSVGASAPSSTALRQPAVVGVVRSGVCPRHNKQRGAGAARISRTLPRGVRPVGVPHAPCGWRW
jgi:hypothetical protein